MTAFLTASWRHLVVASFAAPAAALRPHLPPHVELDLWNGQPLVSLLGLVFRDVRVLGVPMPGYRTFPDVNFRFYARHRAAGGQWTPGVVFVKEIVPRRIVAWLARFLFNEKFVAHPMRYEIRQPSGGPHSVRYQWRAHDRWHHLMAEYEGTARPVAEGSLEHFVLERRRGFVTRRNGRLLTYAIDRTPWRAWTPLRFEVQVDGGALYGPAFAEVLGDRALSVVIAEGSRVAVRKVTP